jgi:acylphosphatase
MSCVQLKISGLVQGVGFRYYTVSCARQLGLSGWVLNLPDGRVEAEIVGEKDKIEELIAQVEVGPAGSRVTGVDCRWQTVEPHYNSFTVRYF